MVTHITDEQGDEPDWSVMISDAMSEPPPVIVAHTFIEPKPGASRAVLVSCDDGADWVIKGSQTGKQAVADQILGILARVTECPTPQIKQVEVTQQFIDTDPELQHIEPGRAHGSKYFYGYGPRDFLSHAIPENFLRFARLAAFYGWGLADDRQFIYRIEPPCLVLSFDHGHFIEPNPEVAVWDESVLGAKPTDAILDSPIETHCPPSSPDLQQVLDDLTNMTDVAIAHAVASPPTTWSITMIERVSLAKLLAKRRDSLRSHLKERLK